MMLTLISTLGGYLVALFPRLFDLLQDRADKKHELDILHMQMRQQLSLSERGYSPSDKTEDVRENDAQDHQQYMAQMGMVYNNQEKLLESSSQWVKDMTAATRPFVTFIFVLELVLINLLTMLWIFLHGSTITSVGEFIQIMEIVFDADEMALLGTIIAMWFGSRGNSKAGK
jgi:hypothetical protein